MHTFGIAFIITAGQFIGYQLLEVDVRMAKQCFRAMSFPKLPGKIGTAVNGGIF